MLFTSYEFLAFIAVLFLLYYVIPKKFQWKLLLLASYLFYLASGPENLLYILFTTVTTYFLTKSIQKNKDAQSAYLKEHKQEMSREERKEYKEGCKKKQ